MRRADLSVHVDRRRPACVLDPSLVLTHAPGPALALRLAMVMEPWLTRSFWHALDASELLLQHGDAVAPPKTDINASALQRWLALREGTDGSAWVLRWIGDRLAESQIIDAFDTDIVERYESLAELLQMRASTCTDTSAEPTRSVVPQAVTLASWNCFDAQASAMDALVLSATLDGALVLCAAAHDTLPPPVTAAERLQLRVEPPGRITPDSLLFAERAFLRDALAAAGLAVMTQSMPPLAAVHVWFDDDEHAPTVAGNDPSFDDAAASNPWSGARVWWYRL